MGACFRKAVPVHLFLIITFGMVAGMCSLTGNDRGTILVVGVLAGALLRDFGWFVRTARAWPAAAAVIDWPRVDQLLAGQSAARPPQNLQKSPPHE